MNQKKQCYTDTYQQGFEGFCETSLESDFFAECTNETWYNATEKCDGKKHIN